MRALICGGLGFVGSHVVRRLLLDGHEVEIIDNRSNALAQPPPGVHCIEASVDTALAHIASVQPANIIFHLASPAGVVNIRPERHIIWQIVRDAHAVFEAALRWRAKVIAFSTPEMYGHGGVCTETSPLEVHLPWDARHEYAIGKMAMECMGFNHVHPLIQFIRPCIVSGPGQNPAGGSVLARFCHQAVRSEPLTIFGDGRQTRQFTHIDDCLDFLWLLWFTEELWREKGIWNVVGDVEISIHELALYVADAAGGGVVGRVDPTKALGLPSFREAPAKFTDSTKARSIGWQPTRGLDQIIREMLDDARQRLEVE